MREKTAIITSDSVEEAAEVLSAKMGFIGPDGIINYVDNKELGFEIEIKMDKPNDVLLSLCKSFGSAELYKQDANYMRVRVPSKSTGQMFEVL